MSLETPHVLLHKFLVYLVGKTENILEYRREELLYYIQHIMVYTSVVWPDFAWINLL